MEGVFKYNPIPWIAARCGDNWDINLPSEPDATGVGVVATCFAGEGIARLIAATTELYEAAEHMLVAHESESATHYAAAIAKLQAALAKARGEAA
jgi:hypothetical protein